MNKPVKRENEAEAYRDAALDAINNPETTDWVAQTPPDSDVREALEEAVESRNVENEAVDHGTVKWVERVVRRVKSAERYDSDPSDVVDVAYRDLDLVGDDPILRVGDLQTRLRYEALQWVELELLTRGDDDGC